MSLIVTDLLLLFNYDSFHDVIYLLTWFIRTQHIKHKPSSQRRDNVKPAS